jgi:Fic-DOC domain mobile mystery protein B
MPTRPRLCCPAISAELNEFEQLNIQRAVQWAQSRIRRLRPHELLEEGFVRDVHRRMFDRTWAWAGTFRTSAKTIGVDWPQIGFQLRNLHDDARHWIEHATFAPDEIAIRYHHRLVLIHPFPNGNGRHSRLLADLVAERLGQPAFNWGGGADLVAGNDTRRRYIASLQQADAGDIASLLAFARS